MVKTGIVLIVALAIGACADLQTSTVGQASTTCVSDPVTGHPIGDVSQCPPPDPYAVQKQETIASAQTNNPSGTVDVNSVSCFSMASGFKICTVTVTFVDVPVISWTCTYSTSNPPVENCNPRASD